MRGSIVSHFVCIHEETVLSGCEMPGPQMLDSGDSNHSSPGVPAGRRLGVGEGVAETGSRP